MVKLDKNGLAGATRTLRNIHGALNELEVKGKQNHAIVVACMNDIEKIIETLNRKEADNGNSNPES